MRCDDGMGQRATEGAAHTAFIGTRLREAFQVPAGILQGGWCSHYRRPTATGDCSAQEEVAVRLLLQEWRGEGEERCLSRVKGLISRQ